MLSMGNLCGECYEEAELSCAGLYLKLHTKKCMFFFCLLESLIVSD